jgi:hypothetical protein
MAARFGMGGFEAGELGQLFALLRGLRLAAGDFVAGPGEPGEPGPAGERAGGTPHAPAGEGRQVRPPS